MAISIISHSEATVANNTEITIDKPAGVQEGDVLIAHISTEDRTVTHPAGWTEKYDYSQGDVAIALAYKVA
ncbi:unnamed protein product, partial [marine sediment metagenome]